MADRVEPARRHPASGPMPVATRSRCSMRPPQPSSRPASRCRCATSPPGPASGSARSTATSRPAPISIVAVYRHQVEACAAAGRRCWRQWSTACGPGPMDRPVRRLPGHQARPRRCAAVRRRRLRGAARLLPRPPGTGLRPAAGGRGRGRRDPLRYHRLRAAVRRRQSVHRGRHSPEYRARRLVGVLVAGLAGPTEAN